MLSFQAPSPPTRKNTTISELLDNSSKKRKWEELQENHDHGIYDKRSKPETTKSIFEIELHLENPLPLEWQQCLDIESGQIHFYNTRTHKTTSKDPRKSPEPPSPSHMSLELELNLPCYQSQRKLNHGKDHPKKQNSGSSLLGFGDLFMDYSSKDNNNKNSGDDSRCPSWLQFGGDQQEMVATVCTRCHMLVMLCKSSPTCPNCKFVHPPDPTSPKLFKQKLSLLC